MRVKATVTIKAIYTNEIDDTGDAEEQAREFIDMLTGDYGEGDSGGVFTVTDIEVEDVEEA